MPLHLLKLCVGVDEVDQLVRFQTARLKRGERLVHVTRHRPRRAAEVLDGGSLYWVIRRRVAVRQRITALEVVESEDGITRCGIVLDPELVRTLPLPRRPHQGWRYYTADEAPPDLADASELPDMPPHMVEELRELGLI
jgi:hypothetical protein